MTWYEKNGTEVADDKNTEWWTIGGTISEAWNSLMVLWNSMTTSWDGIGSLPDGPWYEDDPVEFAELTTVESSTPNGTDWYNKNNTNWSK